MDAEEMRDKLVDERFGRDKERLDKLDDAMAQMTTLCTQLSEIQRRDHEDLKEHDSRICELEHRPSQWIDRIVAAVISSGVAAAVSFLIAHLR